MEVSHAPPDTRADPRNGVLILKKTPINDGDKPLGQVQNAAPGSSAFPCGPSELAMRDLET